MSIPMMAMTTRGVTTMATILPGLSTSGQTTVGEKGIGGGREGGREGRREGGRGKGINKRRGCDWKTRGRDQKCQREEMEEVVVYTWY